MRRRGPALAGIAAGVVAAVLVVGVVARYPRQGLNTGPMLEETGGAIRSVVIQYARGAAFTWPVYREFLRKQPASLTVYVVCPDEPAAAELRREVGPVACRLEPVVVAHALTPWARDRWVELLPTGAGRHRVLLAPREEAGQEIWPERAGDARIAEDLTARLLRTGGLTFRRSELCFDGGDFLADGQWVFVSPAVIQRNLQHTVRSREDLVKALRLELGRQPVLMDQGPDHHAGMFMMAAGEGRMVVGDPSRARGLFAANTHTAQGLEGGPDFTAETQQRFDAVAEQVRQCGYEVRRIPVVPAREGKMYLTYVNVITDMGKNGPVVYMPVYQGQRRMNETAQEVWESLGYRVQPIDCTSVWQRGGALHCLVNVLERAE